MKSLYRSLRVEFKGYDWRSLKKDLLAGLTVTAVALPLALAFGIGSGAGAQAGLITAVIAGFVIGILSGASYQISGPTGAMAVILLPIVMRFGMQGIFMAGIIAGVILIVAAVCNLGKIVSIIPAPVITGFTSGIALLIILGQVDNFFGTNSMVGETTLQKFGYMFTHEFSPNFWAVGIALFTIAFLFAYPKKWGRVMPGTLVVLILVTAVTAIMKLPVNTIGEIPQSLFPDERLRLSAFADLELIKNIFVPASSIAILIMIEALLCGEVGSRMKKEPFDAKQELIAQGAGNLVIPFFGGIPACAAIARTSTVIKSGAVTRLAGIVHAIGLLLSIFVMAPVMSAIPLSVLAGILIVVAMRMNEWHMIKFFFTKKFYYAMATFLLTLLATVLLDLAVAVIAGVFLSCILFILQISNESEITDASIDEEHLSKKGNYTIKKPLSNVHIVYLTGPIFFTTIDQVIGHIQNFKTKDVIILSMRGVSGIDTSGVLEFQALLEELKAHKCQLLIAGLQKGVERTLAKGGVIEKIGADRVFWSAEKAIEYAQKLTMEKDMAVS